MVIEQGNDLGRVHPLWKGLNEVLAHMQPDVGPDQVAQSAFTKLWDKCKCIVLVQVMFSKTWLNTQC